MPAVSAAERLRARRSAGLKRPAAGPDSNPRIYFTSMSHSSVDALVDALVRDATAATAATDSSSSSGSIGGCARRVLIGIAGVPGSGKTTVAAAAAARLVASGVEAVALSMDGFHLTRAQLDAMPVRKQCQDHSRLTASGSFTSHFIAFGGMSKFKSCSPCIASCSPATERRRGAPVSRRRLDV